MLPLSEWQPLLSMQAGAAATLTGLVFVAVSINIGRILETPGLSGRAAESIQHFLQVFFVCSAAMIPRQGALALASEILVSAAVLLVTQTVIQVRYSIRGYKHPRIWLSMRVVQTQLASLPFVIAAVLILLQSPASLYWLVPGFAFSFLAGIANAWVLLIEILR